MSSQEIPTLLFSISVDGTDAGAQEFEQEMVTIGKGAAAVLQINDPALADLHCAVQIGDDGVVTLLDLGSEGGTLLNGNKINNEPLKSGDQIQVGSTTIVFSIPVPEVEEEDTDHGAEQQLSAEEDLALREQEIGEVEDVLEFMLRAGTAQSDLGIDRKAPKILEIAELWSGTVMGVRHFTKDQTVYVGDRAAQTFRIAGGLLVAILVFGCGFFMIKHSTLPQPPEFPPGDEALIAKWQERTEKARQEVIEKRKADQKAEHERRVALAEERKITLEELEEQLEEEKEKAEAENEPANPLRDLNDAFQIEMKKAFEEAVKEANRRREYQNLIPPQFEFFEFPSHEEFLATHLLPLAREAAAKGELRRSWLDVFEAYSKEYDVLDDLEELRVAEDLVLGTRVLVDGEIKMIVPGVRPEMVYLAGLDDYSFDVEEKKGSFKAEAVAPNTELKVWGPSEADAEARKARYKELQELLYINARAKSATRGRCDTIPNLLEFEEEKNRFDYNAFYSKCLADKGKWEQAAEHVARAFENQDDHPGETDEEKKELMLIALQTDGRLKLRDAYGGDPAKAGNELIPVDKREVAYAAFDKLRGYVIEDIQDVGSLKAVDYEINRLEKERLKEQQQIQVWNAIRLGLLITLLLPFGFGYDEIRSRRRAQDFFLSSEVLPNDHFPLVQQDAGGIHINFTKDSVGFVEREGERSTTADLVATGRAKDAGGYYQFELAEDERFVNDFGHVSFFIHKVYRARVIPAPFGQNVDWLFLGVLAALLFVGAALGIHLLTSEYDPSQEVVTIPDRFVKLTVQQVEKEKEKKNTSGNPDAGEGAKAKDEEGKTGKKEAKLKKAKGSKVAVQQQELDKQIAESAGLLADLNQMTDNSLFGSGGLNNSVSSALGGLIGSQYGTQYGSGGLGSRGSGYGGGGTAEGIGGLGTKGSGLGGSGYGRGAGYYGQKGGGVPGVGTADPIVLGALDKSIIDRIVKQHLPQIRYCYQKELNKNPKLFGKIVVKFVIAKDGSVSSASTKSSTMNNPIVEGCINQRFHRMRFPSPKGGGIVIVSYPFVFNSQGG